MYGFGYSIVYLSSFMAIILENQQCKGASGDLWLENWIKPE